MGSSSASWMTRNIRAHGHGADNAQNILKRAVPYTASENPVLTGNRKGPLSSFKANQPVQLQCGAAPCWIHKNIFKFSSNGNLSTRNKALALVSVFPISIPQPRLTTHAGVVAGSRPVGRICYSVFFSSALHTAARPGPGPRRSG